MRVWFVVLLLLAVSKLTATETRANTLTQSYLDNFNANFLLDDEFIIYTYPSRMFHFPTHITLEASLNGNYAYGSLFLIGNSFGGGAVISRRFIYTYAYPPFLDAFVFTPIDLFLGFKLGNLYLALNTLYSNVLLDSTYYAFGDTLSNNFLGFVPSITFKASESLELDISYSFIQNEYFKKITNTLYKFSFSNSLLGGRLLWNNLVLPFSYINAYNYSNSPSGGIDPDFEFAYSEIKFGIGLTRIIDERNLGIIGFIISIGDAKSKDHTNRTSDEIYFQRLGILTGGEVNAFKDWLFLRASITYYIVRSFQRKTFPPDLNQTLSLLGSIGDISLGAGIKVRHIKIDFLVSNDLLYAGPLFISGNPLTFNMSIYMEK